MRKFWVFAASHHRLNRLKILFTSTTIYVYLYEQDHRALKALFSRAKQYPVDGGNTFLFVLFDA